MKEDFGGMLQAGAKEQFAFLALASSEDEAGFKAKTDVLKSDTYSYVGVCQRQNGLVFIKCYQPKGVANKVLGLMSKSRPFRTYNTMNALSDVFPVSKPLAVIRNKHSHNVYLFSEYLNGFNLAAILKHKEIPLEYQQNLLSEVGAALAHFHQLGWCHGDFKWSNILIDGVIGELHEKISFIDLDGVSRLYGLNNRSSRGRDLARFIVNAEDYNIDETIVRSFINAYALTHGTSVLENLRAATPALKKLRKRHDEKYGLRRTSFFQNETDVGA